MLMRTDPFRELDRIAQQLIGAVQPGTWSRPASMPMDAYRTGDELVVTFDLPGVSPDAIEIDIERNVLTVKAERRPLDTTGDTQTLLSERPLGVFSRQMFLSEALDTERIQAHHDNGVLTIRIPVTEHAKPRRIAITAGNTGPRKVIEA